MSIATVIEPGLGTFGDIATFVTDGLASYVGLPQPVMAGYQYGTYSSAWAGNGYWLGAGDNPAAALGDVFITQTTTTPSGYVVQINADVTVEVFVGGDNSRQSFIYERFDLSLNAIDGPATVWINEIGALWSGPVVVYSTVGTAITPVALSTYASSPSGDTLIFALSSGSLPPGLTLSSAGVLQGTPTQAGGYPFVVSATDTASVTTLSFPNQISVVPVYVPPPVAGASTFPPIVSAWTADATNVTADSVSFTCDGADLINGGGSDLPGKPGDLARSKSQYLRF